MTLDKMTQVNIYGNTTISKTTCRIMALIEMKLIKMKLSIMTLSIMTHSIMVLFGTFSTSDKEEDDTQHNII